jgi:transposase
MGLLLSGKVFRCFSRKQGNMAERKPRKTHPPEFKAKVALEAIIGDKSITDIAKVHGLYPNQVIQWKAQGLEGLVGSFKQPERPAQARPAKAAKKDTHLNSLFQQVDKLVQGEVVQEEVFVEPIAVKEPAKPRRTRKSTK